MHTDIHGKNICLTSDAIAERLISIPIDPRCWVATPRVPLTLKCSVFSYPAVTIFVLGISP